MFLRTSVHIFGKNMWGKASPHALKGQKLLAQGIALGIRYI